MSKFKSAIALLALVLFISICTGEASPTYPPAPTCAVTRYAVPGDTFTLKGPDQPQGVTYTYLWTVVDAGGSTMTTVQNSGTQTATFMIPTTSTTPWYQATLASDQELARDK